MDDKNSIFQMRFPQKLWYLLNLRPDAILWGGTGRTILLNYRVLQTYLQCDHSVFKTTNISSFVRQLNLYGFRKVTSHLQDPLCNSSNPYMHEYVHDYFQFGRPELLNKITRKALNMKQSFKPKTSNYSSVEQSLCLTPLQKARHALRMALKKAAQELYLQDSSKQLYGSQLEYEDSQEDICEDEESFEPDWLPTSTENQKTIIPPAPAVSDELKTVYTIPSTKIEVLEQFTENVKTEQNEAFVDSNQDSLIHFTSDSPENNDAFSAPFLSMPDLDSVPTHAQAGVELLAEFNIENDLDEGIARKLDNNEHRSLNCVLPSISQDHNDFDQTESNEHMAMDQYNGEWDQMFNDMINKTTNQECGSDLKELYSQISRTIDLLNS